MKTLIVFNHRAKLGGHSHCGSHFFIVSHHLATFDCHRPCGGRYITDLIFHATSQPHMIKVLCLVTLWKEAPHCIPPSCQV